MGRQKSNVAPKQVGEDTMKGTIEGASEATSKDDDNGLDIELLKGRCMVGWTTLEVIGMFS